jgi:serine/threonine protein kinase
VYRAAATGIGGIDKVVALKVVRREMARDPLFVSMFVEEAKVALCLAHANVVQSFDVGRVDDRYFLAMEFVEGVDLATVLRRNGGEPLPEEVVLRVAVETLQGLHYAHRARAPDGHALAVVHRDVSPQNLLVSWEGEVKIADFGVAKSVLKSSGTSGAAVVGKCSYMAPEQLDGGTVDARADVYSVGAVMYEMLTGRRLFGARGLEALPDIRASRYPKPREVRPEVSEELERLVLRALAPDPEKRPASAAELRDALEQYAASRGIVLSAARLAAFVAGLRTPTTEIRRASIATADTTPERDSLPRVAGIFDALLGSEIRRMETSEPLSVFTARLVDPGGPGVPVVAGTPAPVQTTSSTKPATPAPAPSPSPSPRSTAASPTTTTTTTGSATSASFSRVLVPIAVLGIVAAVAWTIGSQTARPPRARPREIVPPPASPPPVGPPAAPELPTGVEPPSSTDEELPAPAVEPPRAIGEELPPPAVEPPRVPDGPHIAKRGPRVTGPPTGEAPPATDATLSINTDPWSEVTLDGAPIGSTPIWRRRVRAGSHTIVMRNPVSGVERRVTVSLEPGQERTVSMALQ